MVFITESGLKQLGDYKYKSGTYSYLDNKFNPFWEWAVTLLPMTIAPNLVTFIGWIFVILSYSIMLFYDYTFKLQIPRWTFFFAALCIFIYSTLDAIDGKQARRTKSSSPLGQLFDHGCDSFSVTFFILGICQATRLESSYIFYIYVAVQFAFWTSNWIQYHTGILMTNVGSFGVTESQLVCLIIHLITSIFGQKIWDIQFFFNLQLKSIIVLFFGTLIIGLCIYTFFSYLFSSNQKLKVIGQWIPLLSVVGLEYAWIRLSIFNQYCGLILINFGILVSLIVCKMIICSVTKMDFQTLHSQMVIFLVCSILMILFEQRQNKRALIITLWICVVINIISIVNFLYHTINQITNYLGIYCFSLGKREKTT